MVDTVKLGEGPLVNNQVWITKIEVVRSAEEKVIEAGTKGGEWTELGHGVIVDGGTRDPEEY